MITALALFAIDTSYLTGKLHDFYSKMIPLSKICFDHSEIDTLQNSSVSQKELHPLILKIRLEKSSNFDLPYKPNSFDNQKLQRNILDKLNLFEP